MKVEKSVLELTKKLIEFRSETSNKEEINKAQEFVKKYLKRKTKNFRLKIFEHKGVKTYYYTRKNKGPEICLCGHIDVVPAKKEQYKPKQDSSYLYGRGSGDMKSGLAVLIELFINHPDKNLSLLITSDEETGSLNGAGFVVNKINPALVLVTEPTNNNLVLVEKGGAWIELLVKGPGGHASRPHLSKNSVDILFDLIQEIRKKINSTQRDEWKNTLNIGSIEGGNYSFNKNIKHEAANIIAISASARIDVRLTEKTAHKDLFKKIKNIIKNKEKELGKKYEVSYKKIHEVEHLHTKENNEYVKKFKDACIKNKIKPIIKKGHAASDGRFFSKKGIPVILFGPKSIGHHSDNEHADIKTINKTYEVLNTFLEELK